MVLGSGVSLTIVGVGGGDLPNWGGGGGGDRVTAGDTILLYGVCTPPSVSWADVQIVSEAGKRLPSRFGDQQ